MIKTAFATVFLTLATAAPAIAQAYDDGHMGWGWGGGWGHVFGGGILMLLFWAGVIAGIVWLVQAVLRRRSGGASGSGGGSSRSALDILEERYARGEIDREDYQARRQDLLRDKR